MKGVGVGVAAGGGVLVGVAHKRRRQDAVVGAATATVAATAISQ